ncbi:MAG: DUF975 family protein [Clostridiales Family XIII bacterium]|jgi:uncharacterized membrane protein|nr:DUF975 family protein [Clostridiales Family XIII bacterium]
MLDRVDIKKKSKESMKENYWLSVGTYIVILLIRAFSLPVSVIFMPVILVGAAYFSTALYLKSKTRFSDAFSVGFGSYMRNLVGMLWMFLFSVLWSLLFIIPGIVKYYSYFLTPYILARFEDVEAKEALKISKNIMNGHKAEVFVMQLSFIGWGLLSLITIGIVGIFYTDPYYQITNAGFATEIIGKARKENKINDSGHLI